MPRLLTFLPCEKVIISKDDNSPNLIGIFGDFRLTISPTPTEDQPATLPLRWSIFTFWYKEPGDEGRTYEQRADVLSPSGKVLFSQTSEFAMTKQRHRQTGTVFGFPLTGTGTYVLRLSLRDATHEQEFQSIAEFPLVMELDEAADESASKVTNRAAKTE